MASHLFIDLTGRTFGRWTVLRLHSSAQRLGDQTRWVCRCRCGEERDVLYGGLTQGTSKSCGCLRRDRASKPGSPRQKHLREYGIWQGMKTRCTNERHPTFAGYGAVGIRVCPQWENSFSQFISDMGPCPEHWTLERKDNNGDYTPGNCKWASREDQNRNKVNNTKIRWGGRLRLLVDVAREENVDALRLAFLKDRMPLEQAMGQTRAEGRTFIERAIKTRQQEDWC